MWTGAGADNTWMTGANWQGAHPRPGDQLAFPATGVVPASLTNVNNFPTGTSFQSITFQGAGYSISGNRIILPDSGVLTIQGTTGTDTFNAPLTLTGFG